MTNRDIVALLQDAAAPYGGGLTVPYASLMAEAAAELSRLRTAPAGEVERLREALEMVRGIIVDAATVGFNCHDGDWADRLFASQAVTHRALSATPSREGGETKPSREEIARALYNCDFRLNRVTEFPPFEDTRGHTQDRYRTRADAILALSAPSPNTSKDTK